MNTQKVQELVETDKRSSFWLIEEKNKGTERIGELVHVFKKTILFHLLLCFLLLLFGHRNKNHAHYLSDYERKNNKKSTTRFQKKLGGCVKL